MKQRWLDERRCAVCGQAGPRFVVETMDHALLGRESCLIIREDGVVRL